MAAMVFDEKPGCINNTRQKQFLAAAGHAADLETCPKDHDAAPCP